MAQTTDHAAPQTLGGLVAYVNVEGALKAAEFYGKAFGATTAHSVPPDEKGRTMHVHVHVNGSSLMISDFYPEHGFAVEAPQAFALQLILEADEVDAWWQRAVDAGCVVEVPLQVMFWGDRWGRLKDPFGIPWQMNAPVKS